MKMFKTLPVFILLFTGYLCNAEDDVETSLSPFSHFDTTIPTKIIPATEGQGPRDGYAGAPAERSLPTLVVAGVSIALVLLCVLIVAIFWYAWKKSQEGSIELNPIPYGEAGVSLRNLSVPENQQEWPFERAVP